MSADYDQLDRAILNAVGNGDQPLYDKECRAAAEEIARPAGRDVFRVIDARVQALRKKGSIEHVKKSKGGNGWRLLNGS